MPEAKFIANGFFSRTAAVAVDRLQFHDNYVNTPNYRAQFEKWAKSF